GCSTPLEPAPGEGTGSPTPPVPCPGHVRRRSAPRNPPARSGRGPGRAGQAGPFAPQGPVPHPPERRALLGRTPMRLDIITIFPEYFDVLDISLLGKARRAGLLDVHVHDLRDWTHDRHRTVDDTPYGGGPGMVMKPEPWGEALDTLVPPQDADRPDPREPGSAHEPRPSGAAPSGKDSMADDGATADAPPPDTAAAAASASGSADSPGSPAGTSPPPQEAEASPSARVPRLIIPTPSGRPFTQADAVRYAAEPWLMFACGRYEG